MNFNRKPWAMFRSRTSDGVELLSVHIRCDSPQQAQRTATELERCLTELREIIALEHQIAKATDPATQRRTIVTEHFLNRHFGVEPRP